MSVNYTLIFQNNSSNPWTAAIYQNDPDINNPEVMSLAWFAKKANPTTKVQFSWTIDYGFVWSETGKLNDGVIFTASQDWSADLTTSNRVGFTDENGAFTFENQVQGPVPGTLSIAQDKTIPANTASVGVSMSGAGTYVVQAQPNITASFTPHPNYWITFGTYTQGEVMNIGQLTNEAEVAFPPNVYSMTAILSMQNTWSVVPTSQVNASFLQARKSDKKALWGADC